MKLGEAKALIWCILDEHSSGGIVEHDQDIALRIPAMLHSQLRRLSTRVEIPKVYILPSYDRTDGKPQAFPMPEDFFRLRHVWADMEQVSRGTWLGNAIVIPATETRKILIEYAAFPPAIDEDSPDDLELELREDACICACYFTAGALVLADVIVDSNRILAMASQLLEELDKEREPGEVRIREDLF